MRLLAKIINKSGFFVLVNTLMTSTVFAHSLQNFAPLHFLNPADLMLTVKDTQLIFGDLVILPDSAFNGTVTVPDTFAPPNFRRNVITSGQSENIARFHLTFGRFAKRFNKNFIVGVDVTQPFKEDIIYATGSPVRYAATKTSFHSIDVAPNIAFEYKPYKIAVGAGLDFLTISSIANAQFPSLPAIVNGQFRPFGTHSDIEALHTCQ